MSNNNNYNIYEKKSGFSNEEKKRLLVHAFTNSKMKIKTFFNER